jgi:hypothetical protein
VSTPAPIVGVNAITQLSVGDATSALIRQDGTVYMGGRNSAGQLGEGTYSVRSTYVGVVNESFSGFLDLDPVVPNLPVPADTIPPFFLATYRSGGLSSTTLYADIRGLITSGIVASASNFGKFAAGYNLYVAAYVPSMQSSYFQLDSNNHWSLLSWPMAEFIRAVALDSQDNVVRAQILQNVDLSQLVGASVLVGYGTDPDEMVSSARYRTIFTVPRQ